MERTGLGLTKIDPGESPWSDGGSFFGRNQDILDHLARLGALTHRHDAHAPLADPTTAPTVVPSATGGSLPSDTPISVGFTAIDDQGGETLLSPAVVADTPPPAGQPAASFTGTPDYTAGNLPAGTYYYALTATDGAGGETPPSDPVQVIIAAGHANGRVQLAGLIAAIAGAAGWRLYRSANGSDYGLLAAGSTDTYTDDCSDCADTTLPPPDDLGNSAAASASVSVTVPAVSLPAGTARYRIYVSVDPTFPNPSLLGEFAAADAGTAHNVTTLALEPGQPPAVSTSVGGAQQILATRDIDWTGYSGGGGGGSVGAVETWPPSSVRQGANLQGDLIAKHTIAWSGVDGLAVFGRFYELADPDYILAGRDTQVYENAGANDYVPADWLGDTAEVSWDATNGVVDTTGATGADHVIYLPAANAGLELFGTAEFNIINDQWERLVVGAWVPGSTWGFAGVIDRAAGTIAIARIASVAPFASYVMTSFGAADGYTVPVAGDSLSLAFRQVGNHFWVSDSRWVPSYLLHVDLGINDPITLNAAQGVVGGGWSAAGAFNIDYIGFSSIPTARELVAAPVVSGVVDENQAVKLWSSAEQVFTDVGAYEGTWTAVAGRRAPAYRKYRGHLEIIGSVEGGTPGSSIFTLPLTGNETMVPANDTTVTAATDTGATAVTVHTDGTVTSADAGPVHLDISIPLA